MRFYESESFAEVYKNSLTDLISNPEYSNKPRDQKVNEITDVSLKINNPSLGCYNNDRRSTQYLYVAGELVWYFSSDRDIKFIKYFSNFWEKIANKDGTANSAYGHLIFSRQNQFGISQWDWAYSSLIKDTDSRQAVLHFNTPEHQFITNKDFVCTMYGIFQIRDNKLNFSVHMRSNDAILGLPTDVAYFTILQQQMLSLLRKSPYSDKFRNLELGHYIHFDNSLHLYERNFKVAQEMLEKPFSEVRLPSIGLDFVDEKGNMTKNMKILNSLIRDFIEDNTPTGKTFINFSFKDPLFDWIIDTIPKKRQMALAKDREQQNIEMEKSIENYKNTKTVK